MWGAAAVSSGDFKVPFPADGDAIQVLKFNPTGNMLSSGGWDSKVRIWELARSGTGQCSGATPRLEQSFGGPVLDMCWRETGSQMFVASVDGTVQQWDLATNGKAPVAKHDGPIKACVWVPERGFLATASWDKTIKYWDTRSPTPGISVDVGERVYAFDVRAGAAVACLAEGSYQGSAAKEKRILMYDLTNPAAHLRMMASPLRQQTRCVRLSTDGKQFAVGSIEGRCSVRWINQSQDSLGVESHGPFAFKCHRGGGAAQSDIYCVNGLDFHPNQTSVFATLGGGDFPVAFWNKHERKKLKEFSKRDVGSDWPATSGVWSPDGNWFAYSLSYDWSQGVDGVKAGVANVIGIHQMKPQDIALSKKSRKSLQTGPSIASKPARRNMSSQHLVSQPKTGDINRRSHGAGPHVAVVSGVTVASVGVAATVVPDSRRISEASTSSNNLTKEEERYRKALRAVLGGDGSGSSLTPTVLRTSTASGAATLPSTLITGLQLPSVPPVAVPTAKQPPFRPVSTAFNPQAADVATVSLDSVDIAPGYGSRFPKTLVSHSTADTGGSGNRTPATTSTVGRAPSYGGSSRSARSLARHREILANLPVAHVTVHIPHPHSPVVSLPSLPPTPPAAMSYGLGPDSVIPVDLSFDSAPPSPVSSSRQLPSSPLVKPSTPGVVSVKPPASVSPFAEPYFETKEHELSLVDSGHLQTSSVESVVKSTTLEGPKLSAPPPEPVEVLEADSTFASKVQEAMSLAVHYTLPKADLPNTVALTPELFSSYVKMKFPQEGNAKLKTPPHKCGFYFKAKTYSPYVFARLRTCYGVATPDYTASLLKPWIPFSADSKSGQYFFKSTDGRFIIKTQSKAESKFMRKIFHDYYEHMELYPFSYLNRLFGLHRILVKRRYIYFFVMNNIFSTQLKLHRVFDLKGSTLGRVSKVSKKNGKRGILKDVDLETSGQMIRIGPARKWFFMQQLRNDAALLQRLNIMDYSLLLGVHVVGDSEVGVPTIDTPAPRRGSLILPEPAVERKHDDNEDISAHRGHSEPEPGTVGDPPYPDSVGVRGQNPDGSQNNEVYFFGVIDILQQYTFRKAGESFLKGMFFDKETISAVDPGRYAHRFVEFIDKHTM